MAFRFFRRRQKIVIIIMVLLMVSFLLSFMFRGNSSRSAGYNPQIATTRFGPLTLKDRNAAKFDLDLLQQLRIGDAAFWYLLNANGQDVDLAYATLIQEADASGLTVSDSEADRFFEARELTGNQYLALLSQLRERFSGITDQRVRNAVKRWLKVTKMFVNEAVAPPASQAELRRLYRDLNEMLNLSVVRLDANDFLDQAQEPQPSRIVEQFNAFRETLAGFPDEDNPFGFGYKYPDRVQLQYLFIDRTAVERVVEPTDKQVMDYYIAHLDQFTKQLPADAEESGATTADGAASEPASDTTTSAPASGPAFRTVQMTFTEAREQVFQTLKNDMVQIAMRNLTDRAERLAEAVELPPDSPVNPYESVQRALIQPADDLLAKTIDVRIDSVPLSKAIEKLGRLAGVRIAYPWGEHGRRKLDPALRVSVRGDGITLAAALAQIDDQIRDWPKLTWARCTMLGDAIFPAGGVEFLPVVATQTPLLDVPQLQRDPVLGSAFTAPQDGQPLLYLAFGTRVLNPRGSGLELGREGPRMYVLGARPGRLLWRLLDAKPSMALEPVEDVSQLDEQVRKKVVEDLKLQQAFELASLKARQILAEARKATDLVDVAKKAGYEAWDTKFFARKMRVSPQEQLIKLAQLMGKMTPQIYMQIVLSRPHMFTWTRLQDLDLPGEEANRQFITEVFKLVPEDVEPPYPAGPGPMAVVPVPAARQVFVVQRIGYRPAVLGRFEHAENDKPAGRDELIYQLTQVRRYEAMVVWFSFDEIKRRCGFQLMGGEKAGESQPAAQTQPVGS